MHFEFRKKEKMKKEQLKENKKEEIAIKVENLSKTFKIPHEKETTIKGAAINLLKPKSCEIFKALNDVTFDVKKGEFFGIIGRNGSGKSTLLKILAGIYIPDKGKGKVSIKGKLSPFLELGVGFNPELTGRENIFLGGTILGLTKKQIRERYAKIVTFSELEEFIDMKLKNYSSGMQVRLAFSLAINVEADILLMDEVLAVGDTNFQSKCLAEFNKYREQGKTVILVTHDVAVVQRYCDRAMLLRNGKIARIGEAEEVCTEYMNQNIADEEGRLSTGEKEADVAPHKKNAEITKVEFLDKNGNKKNTFETGDTVLAKISFNKNKELDGVNFGMTIVSEENVAMIGISTVIDKIETTKILKNGFFAVEFKDIPLRTSNYHVNAAIFGSNHTEVYDYVTKLGGFKVFSKSQNDGVVAMPYEWKAQDEM